MTVKEELNVWQEKYLSPFCLDKCADSCCAKPWKKVLMNEHQVREIYGIPEGEIITIELGRVPAGTQKDGDVYIQKEDNSCILKNFYKIF